jgi:hypothetical protein
MKQNDSIIDSIMALISAPEPEGTSGPENKLRFHVCDCPPCARDIAEGSQRTIEVFMSGTSGRYLDEAIGDLKEAEKIQMARSDTGVVVCPVPWHTVANLTTFLGWMRELYVEAKQDQRVSANAANGTTG